MMCKNDEVNVARMKEMSLEDKDVRSVMDDKRRNLSQIPHSRDVRNSLDKEDTGETATKTGATPMHLYRNVQAVDTHMKVDLALVKVRLVTNATEEIISRDVVDRENQMSQHERKCT